MARTRIELVPGVVAVCGEGHDDGIDEDMSLPVDWPASIAPKLEAAIERAPAAFAQIATEHEDGAPERFSIYVEHRDRLVSEFLFFGSPDQLGLDLGPLRRAAQMWRDLAIKLSRTAGREIWTTDEEHFAGAPAAWLAQTWAEEIPGFIRFLEANDLDHEVSQASHICGVLETHGWTNETFALALARLTSCCGQHGFEQEFDEEAGAKLGEWIAADRDRRTLAVDLLAGIIAQEARQDYGRGDAKIVDHRIAEFAKYYLDDEIKELLSPSDDDAAGAAIVAEALDKGQEWILRWSAGDVEPEGHWTDRLRSA